MCLMISLFFFHIEIKKKNNQKKYINKVLCISMNKEQTIHSNDISLANDISVTDVNSHILLNVYKRNQILLNKLLLNPNLNINNRSIIDPQGDVKFKILEKADLDLTNDINNDIINLRKQLSQDDIVPDLNDYTAKPVVSEDFIQKVTIKQSGIVDEVKDSEKYFNHDIDEFYKKKQELIEIKKRKEQEELERKLLEQQQQIQYEQQQKQQSQYDQQKQFSNMYNMDLDLNFGMKPDPISTMPDSNMLMNSNANMFNPNMLMDPMLGNPNILKNNVDSLQMNNINKQMMPTESMYNPEHSINTNKISNVNNDFLINDDFEFGDLGDLANNDDMDDFNVDDLDPAFF